MFNNINIEYSPHNNDIFTFFTYIIWSYFYSMQGNIFISIQT